MTYIAPATKILRYPNTLAAMLRGERVWPLHVEFDLAGVCNLSCRHCRFGGRQDGAVMAETDARIILDELYAGGTNAVTLSGGGEPTMNPRFAAIAQYAHAVGLAVGVYTNGINRQALIDAAPWCEWIYVSLDAASAESYARVKGADRFDNVCGTIVELSKRTRTLGVGFLLSDENLRHVFSMRRLGQELGVDYVQFRPVAGLDSYDWVDAALENLAQLLSPVYSPDRFRDLMDDKYSNYARGYTTCRASELVPAIGADGTVWVCPNTRGMKGRSLGNLHEETFARLWARRPTQCVGDDCEPTCRNHQLNKTLELVCAEQAHEEFV